ncbi:MAG: NRDE family protein [Pseudomonadota bacterium]
MCLITFSFNPGAERLLLLAANRDEFHDRPARPMAWWDDPAPILAGRDETAGGTWLAVSREGRWAAVTNVRDPKARFGSRSRGLLPVEFFSGQDSPQGYAEAVQARRQEYGPFNLLMGDRESAWYASSHAPVQAVPPGTHSLSNAALNTSWPKSDRVAARLDQFSVRSLDIDGLMNMMRDGKQAEPDTLPDTGVGQEMEQFLSSPFIVSPNYGTRCTTLISLGEGNRMLERRFNPAGQAVGQLDYRW